MRHGENTGKTLLGGATLALLLVQAVAQAQSTGTRGGGLPSDPGAALPNYRFACTVTITTTVGANENAVSYESKSNRFLIGGVRSATVTGNTLAWSHSRRAFGQNPLPIAASQLPVDAPKLVFVGFWDIPTPDRTNWSHLIMNADFAVNLGNGQWTNFSAQSRVEFNQSVIDVTSSRLGRGIAAGGGDYRGSIECVNASPGLAPAGTGMTF